MNAFIHPVAGGGLPAVFGQGNKNILMSGHGQTEEAEKGKVARMQPDIKSPDYAIPARKPSMAGAETISLPREKIFRLEKNSRVMSIEIVSGVIWLTGTPADGDVLLSSGQCFALPDSRPFVIQALEPAEFSLR